MKAINKQENFSIGKKNGIEITEVKSDRGRMGYIDFGTQFNFMDTVRKSVTDGWNYNAQEGSDSMAKRAIEHYDNIHGDHDWMFGSFNNLDKTQTALDLGLGSELVMTELQKIQREIETDPEFQLLLTKGLTKKRKRVYGESGDELDIDRVLCGDPQHWQSMTQGRKNNVVRLGVNIGLSGGNSEKDFAKLAAYVLVCADFVTKMGYSVEISVLCGAWESIRNWEYSASLFKVKDANEPMDLNRLSCLGIAALFRHYQFIVWTCAWNEHINGGLGSCNAAPKEIKEACEFDELFEKVWSDGNQKFELTKIIKSIVKLEE